MVQQTSSPPHSFCRRTLGPYCSKQARILSIRQVGTALAAGLAPDADAREAGERLSELAIDPRRQALQRRHGKPVDLVEEAVVETVAQAGELRLDDAEIDDPAGLGIGCAAQRHLDAEGMAVEPAIGMAFGRRRQEMRGV